MVFLNSACLFSPILFISKTDDYPAEGDLLDADLSGSSLVLRLLVLSGGNRRQTGGYCSAVWWCDVPKTVASHLSEASCV